MTTVRIRESGQFDDGSFRVLVDFDGAGEYPATVSSPIDAAQERELVWYFEEYLRYPFLDWDRRDAAVRQVAAYGQALFGQVFTGRALYDYQRLRDGGFDGCRLEVVGAAGFHRLHWEALRDPDHDGPLGVRIPVIRRVAVQQSRFDLPTDRATINILVVTARPDGARDVGYRTISRPLLDSLRQAQVQVIVDLVRPGSWAALRDALRVATERHGTGWYQVVHFDLHGLFGDHALLEKQRQAGRLLFEPGEMPAFEGRQGLLFFETGTDGVAEPVTAKAVASLLAEHRVPVAVLNACQSATQSASEAGLAQYLAQAGVPVAVGMAYSVTVSAAERAMPVLYGQLAAGKDPVRAAHAARQALFDHRDRRAYFDQDIELEDWMLPVVFGQQPFPMRLRPPTVEEQKSFFERAAAVGEEPTVRYGFVGRDLDIQAIERRLLLDPDHNLLLVQGMAGAGKSTLLAHLGWWWQRTGLVEQVFSFSYERQAWTAEQVVREIAKSLLTPVEQAALDELCEPAQAERFAYLLRARRYLLVIDNAESITASPAAIPAAIPHALPEPERDRLAALLRRLRGGRTLVLIGSRQDEAWLNPAGTYTLPGLDPQAASQLVERILHAHGGADYLRDPAHSGDLAALVGRLGGYPLPMTVVLPALATSTPATVLAQLDTGDPGSDGTGLIQQAIGYSHGGLDPAIQQSMLLLAPFTAVIPTGGLLATYQQILVQDEAVRALGPIDLAAAVAETTRVGLTAPHPTLASLVQMVPVLPYFLRRRLREQPTLGAAAVDAHYRFHCGLASTLHQLLTSRIPAERTAGQAFTRDAYPNLTSALGYGLATAQPISALVLAVEEYLDQAQQHQARRQLLEGAITGYPTPTTDDRRDELARLHNLAGHTALAQHRLTDARTHHQTELDLSRGRGDRRETAIAHHQLGWVAQEQRRFERAERHYRQALDIMLKLGDRHSAANTYHQLGAVAQAQRLFEVAERHYRRALDIFLEFDDRYETADVHHQLGTVAQAQRRFEEAERHYRQALDLKLEFGDRHGAARTYHQLGVGAQAQRSFEEAERYYRQALDIELEFGDRRSAAGTYHQLGRVAQEQRRFEEAERHLRRALDIQLEIGDRHHAASTYHNLGAVTQEQRRFEEAEQHYRQALDLKLEFGDRYSAASTYLYMGRLLAGLNRVPEAITAWSQAAIAWKQATDSWDTAVFDMIRSEGNRTSLEEFDAAIRLAVPDDLRVEFESWLRAAGTDGPSDTSA